MNTKFEKVLNIVGAWILEMISIILIFISIFLSSKLYCQGLWAWMIICMIWGSSIPLSAYCAIKALNKIDVLKIKK